MRRPRLVWQLFAPLVAIVTGALFLIALFSVRSLRELYEQTTAEALESQARLTAHLLGELGGIDLGERLDPEVKKLGVLTHTRITVMLPDGRVVADSAADPTMTDNHASRPEFVDAMTKGVGRSVRFSNTVRKSLMYVAVPIEEDGRVAGFVRTAVALTAIELLTKDDTAADPVEFGKLAALSGVREFPARVKCASLCWHTLDAALHREAEPVSTE